MSKHLCQLSPPSAHQHGESLAAHAVGRGEGTRNEAAWRAIADFLTLQNLRIALGRHSSGGK